MPNAASPIYSELGADPDLAPLVEMFVDEMPERCEQLRALLEAADAPGLHRFAHQLKGSAGSYGFPQLTPLALRVEQAAKQGEPEADLAAAVQELIDLCAQARAGTPPRC